MGSLLARVRSPSLHSIFACMLSVLTFYFCLHSVCAYILSLLTFYFCLHSIRRLPLPDATVTMRRMKPPRANKTCGHARLKPLATAARALARHHAKSCPLAASPRRSPTDIRRHKARVLGRRGLQAQCWCRRRQSGRCCQFQRGASGKALLLEATAATARSLLVRIYRAPTLR